METYLSIIESNNTFLAGYHRSQAIDAEKTYMSEHFRILRVVSGSGRWKIENKIYDVRQNDIIFFSNITTRQIFSVTDSPLVYELVGFTSGVLPLEKGYINMFYSEFPDNPLFKAEQTVTAEIHTVFDLLKQKFNESPKSSNVIANLITTICALADDYFNSWKQQSTAPEYPTNNVCRMIAQAIRYIERELYDIKTVSDVANHIHVSRVYLYKIFTKYMGYTPKYYINYCRIMRFISLTSTHNITILDAAMRCGFNSAAGFYKTFHSICGMSPKEYFVLMQGACLK